MPRSENGFTLIELLVTVAVLGTLAAIALPNFLGRQQAATDASAKALAHSGAIALQSYAVEHDGYAATAADLVDLSPDLGSGNFTLRTTASSYALTVTARDSHTFTIQRTLGGPATRTCSTPGAGGCGSDGSW